jgi:predicted nucleic acid-binding protein
MSVISNTTVLSNFAFIRQLSLLQRLYGILYIPVEVYEEITTGLAEGYSFYQDIPGLTYPFQENGWLRITPMNTSELRLSGKLPPRLHKGEASCLAIAQERAWLLLTDDRAARSEALRRGIRLSGSVGCLVLATERGHCTVAQANAWLHNMIQRDYRSPVTDITPLLSK